MWQVFANFVAFLLPVSLMAVSPEDYDMIYRKYYVAGRCETIQVVEKKLPHLKTTSVLVPVKNPSQSDYLDFNILHTPNGSVEGSIRVIGSEVFFALGGSDSDLIHLGTLIEKSLLLEDETHVHWWVPIDLIPSPGNRFSAYSIRLLEPLDPLRETQSAYLPSFIPRLKAFEKLAESFRGNYVLQSDTLVTQGLWKLRNRGFDFNVLTIDHTARSVRQYTSNSLVYVFKVPDPNENFQHLLAYTQRTATLGFGTLIAQFGDPSQPEFHIRSPRYRSGLGSNWTFKFRPDQSFELIQEKRGFSRRRSAIFCPVLLKSLQ